jgi:hypothetical protein
VNLLRSALPRVGLFASLSTSSPIDDTYLAAAASIAAVARGCGKTEKAMRAMRLRREICDVIGILGLTVARSAEPLQVRTWTFM